MFASKRSSRRLVLVIGKEFLLLVLISPLILVHVSPASGAKLPIEHIVVIFQENRSFDHYFGTYPGANGISGNISLPVEPGSSTRVRPLHLSTLSTKDLSHSYATARMAYNDGKMDGFVYAEGSNLTMGYYDYRDIPYYWDYASEFVLMDNFFSSEMGPSLPNHLYLVAGQSDNLTENVKEFTLNFETIVDELDSRGISWRYYSDDEEGFKVPGVWNPLPAFESFKMNSSRLLNLAPNDQFLKDLSNGSLANVVWIMPKTEVSEHPPQNIQDGEHYVVSLVNAIMESTYWNSTAIFITWDDYGGWYDHVPPPQMDAFGLGFRVPCLIISPYAKRGFVDHEQSEFASILRFIEVKYSLPPLTHRDANASDLTQAFDFTQPPRSPLILPGPYIPDRYPLTPISQSSPPAYSWALIVVVLIILAIVVVILLRIFVFSKLVT